MNGPNWGYSDRSDRQSRPSPSVSGMHLLNRAVCLRATLVGDVLQSHAGRVRTMLDLALLRVPAIPDYEKNPIHRRLAVARSRTRPSGFLEVQGTASSSVKH